jgi:hypothetical protein
MKNLINLTLFAGAIMLSSCNFQADPGKTENTSEDTTFAPSSSIFEGEWTWLGTKGEGIAGPYETDSVQAGYSWKYVFYESEGKGGKVKSFKNGIEETACSYTYTESENPSEQRLDMGCNKWINDNSWFNYLWEIKVIEEKQHLYLRNVEDCCDNTFEHHFLLTEGPNL